MAYSALAGMFGPVSRVLFERVKVRNERFGMEALTYIYPGRLGATDLSEGTSFVAENIPDPYIHSSLTITIICMTYMYMA